MLHRIAAVALISAAVAACAGSSQTSTASRPDTGSLMGSATGSLGGAPPAGDPSEPRMSGPVSGAAIGGMVGNRVGSAMDDEDKRRAYAAQIDALESGTAGAPVAWRNPDSGRYGSIVPGPQFQRDGATCRSYTHTIYLDGTPQTARGTACRGSGNTWEPVS